MSNIYETTIIVKPDLANDQMKNLNSSIEQFFNDNQVPIGYKEDWGIKNLKFSIDKYSKGSFKFMRFNATSEFPKKLDGFLKIVEKSQKDATKAPAEGDKEAEKK